MIIDFNWEKYRDMNPYLYLNGLRTKEDYEMNYFKEGRFIGRMYKEEHKSPISIHVLIATIGNDSIFKILSILADQLEKRDYITIVFDAPSVNYYKVEKYCNNIKATCNVIMEEKNLGYWGHGIRNKHNQLKGDFVFHCDDDDVILPNACNKIRKICKNKDMIYIFKIITETGEVVWKRPEIKLNEISTQSGLIPVDYNSQAKWAYQYGGDYVFYKELSEKFPMLFIPEIIYQKKRIIKSNKFNKRI
jgi:hypothetical protein